MFVEHPLTDGESAGTGRTAVSFLDLGPAFLVGAVLMTSRAKLLDPIHSYNNRWASGVTGSPSVEAAPGPKRPAPTPGLEADGRTEPRAAPPEAPRPPPRPPRGSRGHSRAGCGELAEHVSAVNKALNMLRGEPGRFRHSALIAGSPGCGTRAGRMCLVAARPNCSHLSRPRPPCGERAASKRRVFNPSGGAAGSMAAPPVINPRAGTRVDAPRPSRAPAASPGLDAAGPSGRGRAVPRRPGPAQPGSGGALGQWARGQGAGNTAQGRGGDRAAAEKAAFAVSHRPLPSPLTLPHRLSAPHLHLSLPHVSSHLSLFFPALSPTPSPPSVSPTSPLSPTSPPSLRLPLPLLFIPCSPICHSWRLLPPLRESLDHSRTGSARAGQFQRFTPHPPPYPTPTVPSPTRRPI